MRKRVRGLRCSCCRETVNREFHLQLVFFESGYSCEEEIPPPDVGGMVVRYGSKRETRAASNSLWQRYFTARRPCFPSPLSVSAHHSANKVSGISCGFSALCHIFAHLCAIFATIIQIKVPITVAPDTYQGL